MKATLIPGLLASLVLVLTSCGGGGGQTNPPPGSYTVKLSVGTHNEGSESVCIHYVAFFEPELAELGTLTITGPAGWNGDQPYSVEADGTNEASSTCGNDGERVALSGTYTLRLEVAGETYDETVEVDATQLLPAPEGITVTGGSLEAVSASWEAVPGASSYVVSVNAEDEQLENISTTETSATVDGLSLAAGTEYDLIVRAYTSDRETQTLQPGQNNRSEGTVTFIAGGGSGTC